MNKFAFENDRYLERNVKAVVEKIARDFNLHLKSKYSKDCEFTIVADNSFDNIENGAIFLEIQREDGKACQDHHIYAEYECDEDDNEYVALTVKFYGSSASNQINTVQGIKSSKYASCIVSDTDNQLSKSIHELNLKKEKEQQEAWNKKEAEYAIRKQAYVSQSEREKYEDIFDLPFDFYDYIDKKENGLI
ncbi:hypothetical protein [Listeria welshimeri]|uniref:hypothetical protein n=1 Tax=Listeria welshimeri TaxID=1643 RepID=UPI00188790FE|nr:hypothetical protein [Listeria welshimeri]MBF2507748.1 hypothetical protein [Listeria welshimeri]MBF2696324.1 hypothetical protein [Listeria welshimeri]